LPEIVTLALPCGGLSGVSQFLAESTLRTEVRYYYDIDASLRGALEALHGNDALGFRLGSSVGKVFKTWLSNIFLWCNFWFHFQWSCF
jgi:hypothetical protein